MPDAKQPRDRGASVRARLLALARQRGQAFDLLLTRYVMERLLHRLSLSDHRERFVLKGAMLVTTWFNDPHRPTRDIDLLGYCDPTPDTLLATFRDVLAIVVDDGIEFDLHELRTQPIREDTDYGGLRLRTTARLAGARIAVVIDVGFGDAIEPGAEIIDLPVLLDLPPPRMRAYARETVIAEKYQAMVALGLANSRMKDFYDVWALSRTHTFDPDRLSLAMAATFQRRRTAVPHDEAPTALTPAFSADAAKRTQWTAFTRDLAITVPDFSVVVEDLAAFLMPHSLRAALRSSATGDDA